MNKPQLIAAVADKSGLSKLNAERALAALAKKSPCPTSAN